MSDKKTHGSKFWAGNAILAISLAVLFFMDVMSTWLGVWAMALWMGLAGLGFYLVTTDKSASRLDNTD